MSIAHGQFRTFERQLVALRPDIGGDVDVPARIESLIRRERSAGSRDRRLYRELHYTYLRHLPWLIALSGDALAVALATLCAESPATRSFRAAFLESGSSPPAFIPGQRADLLPAWLRQECPEAFQEPLLSSLNSRAPFWVRLQGPRAASALAEMDALGWAWHRSTLLPDAVSIEGDRDATRLDTWAQGSLEVQDLGSQLILASQSIPSGGRWFDACAGAGGKALQLAWLLGAAGLVEASDVRLHALDELAHRAHRAGIRVTGLHLAGKSVAPASGTSTVPASPPLTAATVSIVRAASGLYDGVLIDAPCSGSGTWRRAPHLKWSTSPASVSAIAQVQAGLLETNAAFVRPGGLLLYATCSLCAAENELQIERFLRAHPCFTPVPPSLPSAGLVPPNGLGLRILPHLHDSDGYYVCMLRLAAD